MGGISLVLAVIVNFFFILVAHWIVPKYLIIETKEVKGENGAGRKITSITNKNENGFPFKGYLNPLLQPLRNPHTHKGRSVIWMELLIASLNGVVAGIRPMSGSCVPMALLMVAFGAIHLVFLIVTRPYKELLDTVFSFLISALTLGMGITALIVTILKDGSAEIAGTLAGFSVLQLLANFSFFIQLVVSGVWAWVRWQKRLHYLKVGKQDNNDNQGASSAPLLSVVRGEIAEGSTGEEGDDVEMSSSNKATSKVPPRRNNAGPGKEKEEKVEGATHHQGNDEVQQHVNPLAQEERTEGTI